MYITMITIETQYCNPLSQDFYDKTISSVDLNRITCTCGHAGSLIWYGSYLRKVRLPDRIITLRAARVFCKSCGHTHAILLSSIVPYSQIPLPVQTAAARCYEMKKGYAQLLAAWLSIDENTISSIIRSYRLHWRERLKSASLPLQPLPDLVRGCFASFSRSFMQIKTTRNKLFPLPT